MKPLSAKWVIEMAEYFTTRPEIILNGFSAAGTYFRSFIILYKHCVCMYTLHICIYCADILLYIYCIYCTLLSDAHCYI